MKIYTQKDVDEIKPDKNGIRHFLSQYYEGIFLFVIFVVLLCSFAGFLMIDSQLSSCADCPSNASCADCPSNACMIGDIYFFNDTLLL